MISLLKSIHPEQAEGRTAAVYEQLKKGMGMVPNVLQFQTASEDVFMRQMDSFRFLMEHETLGRELLAWIRLIISQRKSCEYCVRFNSGILSGEGASREEIAEGIRNPEAAILNAKDKAMLMFVIRILFSPEEINELEMRKLHEQGWTDKEIFEASWAGAKQYGMVQLIKGFKVELDI